MGDVILVNVQKEGSELKYSQGHTRAAWRPVGPDECADPRVVLAVFIGYAEDDDEIYVWS